MIKMLERNILKIIKFPIYMAKFNITRMLRSFVLVGDLGRERRGATRSSGHVESKPWSNETA